MNNDIEVLRTMKKFRWGRKFATEYTLARTIHGLSHDGAIRAAKRSPLLRQGDIPYGI